MALLVGRHAIGLPHSPFRLRPNYAVPSGLSGNPASACRATARKGRKLNALLAALLFAASGAAQAKSITALTPSFFDVNKAIGSAVDGDTVIIPAGKASWTSPLAITKAITLMGQTTTDSVAGTANDKTIVQYNLTDTRPLINVQSVAGKVYRISGITFQSISSVASANGFIVLEWFFTQGKTGSLPFCAGNESSAGARYSSQWGGARRSGS